MTGFGQVIGVASPVLQAEQQGGYWSQYPTQWQRGMAAVIQPSTTPGGAPSGWNKVPVNLAKMLKRMEAMRYPIVTPAERQLIGI